ncbi:hypothetical protein PHET_09693 [Paragonimus heterotremus]|uniref:Uncharacterized protein n=1 Tax=Paragonimus heterotremus TaxID=100268 RepID=A0A8J4SSV2_9TREM|nr:hypothetical protein PHET_09693 [Paragonimus heterotremus]
MSTQACVPTEHNLCWGRAPFKRKPDLHMRRLYGLYCTPTKISSWTTLASCEPFGCLAHFYLTGYKFEYEGTHVSLLIPNFTQAGSLFISQFTQEFGPSTNFTAHQGFIQTFEQSAKRESTGVFDYSHASRAFGKPAIDLQTALHLCYVHGLLRFRSMATLGAGDTDIFLSALE